MRIAKLLGLTIKWWTPKNPTNPDSDIETLKPLLSEKTRLVAFPHASNITGTITNVKEVAAVVHQFPRVGHLLHAKFIIEDELTQCSTRLLSAWTAWHLLRTDR